MKRIIEIEIQDKHDREWTLEEIQTLHEWLQDEFEEDYRCKVLEVRVKDIK